MLLSRTYQIIGLFVLIINAASAKQLENFKSDGCSQFPDGTLYQKNLWCDCCINHDIAYWQGGSQEQKEQADRTLKDCVLKQTESSLLSNVMHYGVIVGGSPALPTWFRWGYGWPYGRGFQSLNNHEKQQVKEKLQHYQLSESNAFCEFEHPLSLKAKELWQKFTLSLE